MSVKGICGGGSLFSLKTLLVAAYINRVCTGLKKYFNFEGFLEKGFEN